jgi:hypothetical protein
MPNLDKRERLGREVDLIAAYRQVMHESPSCQFAGIPGELMARYGTRNSRCLILRSRLQEAPGRAFGRSVAWAGGA